VWGAGVAFSPLPAEASKQKTPAGDCRLGSLLRADSGFANDELMAWCEANRVDYVSGLARNALPAPLLFINHDDVRLAEFSAGERPDERDHFGFTQGRGRREHLDRACRRLMRT
jgi:hypothetical protein